MIVTLSEVSLGRLGCRWPDLCCGCGAPAPGGTFPAWLRQHRNSALGVVGALGGGGAEWKTTSIPLPACSRCRLRGHVGPWLFAAVCAALFVIGLTTRNPRFEDDGTPVVGITRAIRLGRGLGFAFALFLGPPLFLVLQRRLSPALIADLRGPETGQLPALDLDVGSAAFARAVEQAAHRR